MLLSALLGCSGAAPPKPQVAEATAEPSTQKHSINPHEGEGQGPGPGSSSPQGSARKDGKKYQPTEELPPLLHPVRDTAWLGVELKDLERGVAGVRVERVFRGSPAAHAGLEVGDILLALEGKTLSSPREVNAAVRRHRPGKRVSLSLLRGQRERLFPIELASLPQTEDLARLHFVGLPAPELGSLATVQGQGRWDWQTLQGQVVVIEFWARWCVVCRYLVPVMNQWHQRYRPQGVTLLGITSDPVAMADRAIVEMGMTYAVASDRSGQTTLAFAARELPTVFVVDQRGIVRDVMVGLSEPRLRDLENLVERLLAEL